MLTHIAGWLCLGMLTGSSVAAHLPLDPTQAPLITQESAKALEDKRSPANNAAWTPIIHTFPDPAGGDVQMVYVPPGSFDMGSDTGHTGSQPVHNQTLSQGFWLDKTEVTRAAYQRCVEADACSVLWENPLSSTPDHPANFVSWYAAVHYCRWRGGRLPTEREWEYAARGFSHWDYPWGNDFIPTRVAHTGVKGQLSPVGSYPDGASWVGAEDMSGNVWEWTASLYQVYPYIANDHRELIKEDSWPLKTEFLVLRGGSFENKPTDLKTSRRFWGDAGLEFRSYGLRCMCPL